MLTEHISDKAILFSQIQPVAIAGHDACGILAPVLQDCQSIVELIVNIVAPNDSDYAAHKFSSAFDTSRTRFQQLFTLFP